MTSPSPKNEIAARDRYHCRLFRLHLPVLTLCLFPYAALSEGNIDGLLRSDRCERRSSISDFVQPNLERKLREAIIKFRASAGWALLSDVRTGEVIGYSEIRGGRHDGIARVTSSAAKEHSSSPEFKSLVIALGLETGAFSLRDKIDLRKATARPADEVAVGRQIALQDAFTLSSAAGMHLYLRQRKEEFEPSFLGRMNKAREYLKAHGLPSNDTPLSSISPVRVGYGLRISPIELLALSAATVNGGELVPLRFERERPAECPKAAPFSLVQSGISLEMRLLLKRNGEIGSIRKANTSSVPVGGEAGVMISDQGGSINFLLAAFPIERPEHQLFIALENPRGTNETFGFSTPTWNVVPLAGKLIGELDPGLTKVVPADPTEPR